MKLAWRGHVALGICVIVIALALFIQGCGVVESTEQKQLKTCVAEIKLGLNDPNSLEVLETKWIEVTGGKGHRLQVSFTAKNKMGGRVRGSEVCGFKTKTDTVLDPDDYQNKMRSLARSLGEIGMKIK